jgi:DNA polymerase III sliding clamp (beta) subunit (PCNA family)
MENSMKIDPRLKLEKIAGAKDMRHSLHNPYLDVGNKCVVATDGHKLVKIPVELSDGDTSGPIPLEVLKDARQRKLDNAEIRLNGDATLVDNTTGEPLAHYARPVDVEFPDYKRVIPGREGLGEPGEDAPILSIGLNARYLQELALALTTIGGRGDNKKEPIVRLDFFDAARAVKVTVESEPDRIGVIMPCALEK